ncbi:MAG: hypothetical protein Q4B77_07015 [Coriobacteriaceae bacterium]|nr:hypothetical protein [Coriobacteriaceae bacterium]
MSGSRKMLKLVSIVAAISGLVMLLFGLGVAGCGLFGGTAISGTDAAPVYMGVSGVSALCFVVMGLMGMRASNVPSRSGTSLACAFGSIAVTAVAVVFWAWQGFVKIDVVNAILLVAGALEAIAVLVLTRKVKKEHDVWH